MGSVASFESTAMGGVADRVPAFGNADPLGVYNFFAGAYRKQQLVMQGYIITYNPQTHSAAVQIQGAQSVWTCVFADELLSYSFGFSETHPAKEGELVLVISVEPETQSGIIIGRIPYPLCFKPDGDKYNDPDGYHRRFYTQDDLEKETWDKNIPSFMKPFEDPNDDTTHIATHFRPTDVYPGEFAHLNQHNCGIKGGLFSSTLIGGGASLRMSALTNAARLTCESYLRHSMAGNMHEFHNGRYLSTERELAMYQEERLGGCKIMDKVWTKDAEAPIGTGEGKDGENQIIRPRIRELTGYFGHLVSRYCLRPDPSEKKVRVLGKTKPKEAGVSRETIDPSGQYRLSAAGMIVIERTGRIPVPVRIARPTDKDHELESNKTLQPFEHEKKDPAYRQLELFDRQAYDLKNQYARVDGIDVDDPDYYVPTEAQVKPLEDSYDKKFFGNETVKLKKYDKRRAGIFIGEDGSVIVRDAWGSEIVMLGGNITLSCAGNVMTLPGKTALTLAGDDIVHKANNSIDIHASRKDIRLSAVKNIEMVSKDGGMILEAKGTGGGSWDGKGDDKGEGVNVSGITIKGWDSGVNVIGKMLRVKSRERTFISSGDEGELNGSISIGADTFRTRSKKIIMTTEKAGLGMNEGGFVGVGRTVALCGDRSLVLTNGGKYPVPIKWVDIDNIASTLIPQYKKSVKDISDEKGANGGMGYEDIKKMVFSFRTSAQCGTDKNWTLGASGEFRMYEPAWVQVVKIYETLKKNGVDTKVYEEGSEWEDDEGGDDGLPWPGKDAKTSAMYAQLLDLSPTNLTDNGFNRSRKKVENRSETTEVPLFDHYLIRK